MIADYMTEPLTGSKFNKSRIIIMNGGSTNFLDNRSVLVEVQKVGTYVPIPVAKKVDFGQKRRPLVKKSSTK
jgi:hypothetical protein